ncbi:pyruvate kinase [Gimesia fumaroli]|uniref:pyruvate kinase n=1 Tax=Gimesia fumaroli TaxID=2527976 RepID=A0A518IIJ5_9PLAN|nr:pyruvate kinase [Gimesia fumaroli]QDV52860.1 Pyruvate kinase [Gimesia fumaroli]
MTLEHSTTSSDLTSEDYEPVLKELATIRSEMVIEADRSRSLLDQVHPCYRESARNLLHYLALRHHDIRPLQIRLAALGLSSLGRAESHVMATVDAVLDVLHRLAGHSLEQSAAEPAVINFATGERLLVEHTETLLGPAVPGRWVRIMVTMPSEAADDYHLVHDLLQQGMDCMRINCAHDDATAWLRMIEHLRRAEKSLGRSCQVIMDLAGPKLRTGPLEPGPAVVKIRPRRDLLGQVTAPARVWLFAETNPQPSPSPADACLPVPEPWLSRMHQGEEIQLTDARGSRRTLTIVDLTDEGCWAEAVQTTYVIPGTVLKHEHKVAKAKHREAAVGDIAATENDLTLFQGDQLIITRNLEPGRPVTHDSAGEVLTPAQIGCTIPDVFNDVRAGQSIWFDDGKIGGVIEKVDSTRVLVRITQARLSGAKLRADKGINLPESNLSLNALTDKDLADLAFVAQHADVVEMSFANRAEDVEMLQQYLTRLDGRQPAIVLKIETRRGFENLPDMLLTAMRSPCCGVMIARGDLAVESGFERLAEVQEEILWICEAAHVPVIWATQVLESLAKEGMPSRAEITDAAMGHRAECVMLNKGQHVLHAVRTLDDILRRMQSHQTKKRAMLRELRLATHTPSEKISNTSDPAET